MRYHSHIVTSLCLGAAAAAYTSLSFTASYTAGVVIGSLLPDIDEPKSYVGRRSMGMSNKVKEAFGHRGMTHSLVVWGVIALVISWESSSLFAAGFVLGYLFHILEDFFSVQGVPLFWPFTVKRLKIPIYRTGNLVEKALFYVAFALLVYIGAKEQLFSEWWHSLALFR
ncbi:membrane-bound metal-dependent hydrolase [Parageobacillus genomosp. 1]|uniref:Membrane-bound metal-dependent hydrolase n=1 Tax=Parageobacillus genomosp. 1 TaxID=1295642 RepID=A0ABC9VFU4_9BACL|nr:metal-dependent hydrolase [Parageobacillus genomosp. 1]EZP77407.1 membrane-bound metal-dependent hydrolase [Parageobacillus genomosp. 1]